MRFKAPVPELFREIQPDCRTGLPDDSVTNQSRFLPIGCRNAIRKIKDGSPLYYNYPVEDKVIYHDGSALLHLLVLTALLSDT